MGLVFYLKLCGLAAPDLVDVALPTNFPALTNLCFWKIVPQNWFGKGVGDEDKQGFGFSAFPSVGVFRVVVFPWMLYAM